MAIDWESLINELPGVDDPGIMTDPLRAEDVEPSMSGPGRCQEGVDHWLYGWVAGPNPDPWQC